MNLDTINWTETNDSLKMNSKEEMRRYYMQEKFMRCSGKSVEPQCEPRFVWTNVLSLEIEENKIFCLKDETSVAANKNSHKDLKFKHLQAFKNGVVE
jgi:hypothetical protein